MMSKKQSTPVNIFVSLWIAVQRGFLYKSVCTPPPNGLVHWHLRRLLFGNVPMRVPVPVRCVCPKRRAHGGQGVQANPGRGRVQRLHKVQQAGVRRDAVRAWFNLDVARRKHRPAVLRHSRVLLCLCALPRPPRHTQAKQDPARLLRRRVQRLLLRALVLQLRHGTGEGGAGRDAGPGCKHVCWDGDSFSTPHAQYTNGDSTLEPISPAHWTRSLLPAAQALRMELMAARRG